MTRQQVALIGAGMAVAPHVASLGALAERVDVGWIVTQSGTRAAAIAERLRGARCSTSLDDVLSDDRITAALVLTPPNTHLEIVTRLAGARKHVLLEKPLELDSRRAGQLVAVCAEAGVQLGVMLQHRLRPASLAMKRLVQGGALGEMTCASVDMRWWRPQSYYDQPGRGSRARDGGGVLLTQGIHTIDNFLQIAGLPSELVAFAHTSPVHRMECEDVVAAALRYANGATATLNATVTAFPGFSERIEVCGTLATATLAGGQLEVHWHDGRHETIGQAQMLGGGADPMAFTHEAHQAVIEDFLDAIAQAREPAISGASVLPVQRLIDALLQSAATRQVLDFGG
ncbi:Gfo/Idh/MocA family oxidoreductase [Aquincola sp. S2]|uniref:Gfo/Idh/MocA family oxidoreductase n=1 Tax=Pseudaquabacterium terrae TaxID=2732868 RepID=A0ABX2EEA2_9BURK|nr:Gfo/Idh/MocA family oxidoreductase [Aquabacterium terrae]NRF66947.1 Gfo/Idh/MocA family oxidoreductase [Aquabacterium terrae]